MLMAIPPVRGRVPYPQYWNSTQSWSLMYICGKKKSKNEHMNRLTLENIPECRGWARRREEALLGIHSKSPGVN